MTIHKLIALASEKGRVVRPSAIDADYAVLDCGPAPNTNERIRITSDGAMLIVDEGRYWQAVPVNSLQTWLEGLK